MKKRGYFIVGILLAIFIISFVLAAEGYLTNTNGFWADNDENILGSETIVLDSSQLEGIFGGTSLNITICEDQISFCVNGQQITPTDNMFKTYISGIALPACPESGENVIYFEVYEKDDSIERPGEDGTDDPIRVGTSKLNGIIRAVTPNCLTSVAIAPWAISLNDITNAGTETDGIYEFYYKAITFEGDEKAYNDTILNINITWPSYANLTENLSTRWYDFNLNPISTTVQFDSVDLASPTPSIDNSVYFEISGLPKTAEGQTVNVEIYENDSIDGLTDDEIRTNTKALIGNVDSEGKARVLWKLTEEDIELAEVENTYEFYAKITVDRQEVSFKDTPVFIEINSVPADPLANAGAIWMDRYRIAQKTYWLYKSSISNDLAIYATNIDAPEGTSVSFEIYEEDGLLGDDSIRTGVNALTDDVDANGVAFVIWTMTEEDLGAAGAGGSPTNYWEFYPKLIIDINEKEFADEILEVENQSGMIGEECVNVNFCVDYTTGLKCEDDNCTVTIEIPGIDCLTDPDVTCYCAWNETESACAAQWSAVSPGGNGTNGSSSIIIGSCGYDENTAGDTCEDDGFLSYSWTASWVWDSGNIYATEGDCWDGANVSSGCVQDPLTLLWHYDPENQNLLCIDGENSLACPAQVQLSGFNWINWVLIAIALVIIYYIIISRKKKKVKTNKKK